MRVIELIKEEEPKTLPETSDKVDTEHIWQYIWKVYTGEIDISAS